MFDSVLAAVCFVPVTDRNTHNKANCFVKRSSTCIWFIGGHLEIGPAYDFQFSEEILSNIT